MLKFRHLVHPFKLIFNKSFQLKAHPLLQSILSNSSVALIAPSISWNLLF
jgi:hypothetical protein